MQCINRVLDGELIILHCSFPCSSIYRSNHQVIIADDIRVDSGEDSHQQILYLVLVGDKQITLGAVAACLIHRHRMPWIHMDEQREFTLPSSVSALRATRESYILIWIEKEAVKWELLAKSFHDFLTFKDTLNCALSSLHYVPQRPVVHLLVSSLEHPGTLLEQQRILK